MSDHIFNFPISFKTHGLGVSKRRKLVYAIYILAIAIAMLGWFWLIVWCVMKLI